MGFCGDGGTTGRGSVWLLAALADLQESLLLVEEGGCLSLGGELVRLSSHSS